MITDKKVFDYLVKVETFNGISLIAAWDVVNLSDQIGFDPGICQKMIESCHFKL